MGKLLKTGRTVRGADFISGRTSIWVGLGRTTPWAEELNPPDEAETATEIEEVFGLKLYTTASHIVQDSSGPINFKGQKYRILTLDEAYEQKATDLYLEFEVQPDEFAEISYRQIGVYVDAIPKPGFSGYTALNPNRFDSLGKLIYLSNLTKQTRYPNTRHVIEVVIPG